MSLPPVFQLQAVQTSRSRPIAAS